METTSHGERTTRALRLWPGVVLVVLQLVLRFVLPWFAPDTLMVGTLGVFATGILFLVWWAFFSRAPRVERWIGTLLILVVLFGAAPLLHVSVATAMFRLLFPLYALPLLCVAFLAWAALGRGWPAPRRRVALVVTIVGACAPWALVRTGGLDMELDNDFAWRWSATPEDRLLAHEEALAPLPVARVEEALDAPAAWPGFRGAGRDAVVRGVEIATDWEASPPVELWRRAVGPGWSSFAVRGELVYTQEQRGDDEVVACYELRTGEPVWRHGDPARFWEAVAGAGPRATPTLAGAHVYALGATGVLNALRADDGSVVWSRDAGADTQTEVPGWGFAGSPLVLDGVVIVAVQGTLAAYDAATGEPRWFGPRGGGSYSSPHLFHLGGVPQVVLLSRTGAVSVAPQDGRVLWEYPWEGRERIVQPTSIGETDLLISRGEMTGLRRVGVIREGDAWTLAERWTKARLKPYFNDLVVHRGHAFGIDANVLTCVDLESGERAWKDGRYGSGQLFLLADQDLLVVLSESGELALVAADPEAFRELARFPVLTGKTWNHPVLVGDTLLVRNAEEMAAFRLTLASN